MTRVAARELAMHLVFESFFLNCDDIDTFISDALDDEYLATLASECEIYSEMLDDAQRSYVIRVVSGILNHAVELDSYIEKYAKNWNFERISKVSTAIMRVAMYEVMYMPEIPNAAAINAAIDIAKEYEEESVKFINGILGSFSRQEF